MIDADEVDALGRNKRWYRWRAGDRSWVKRKFRRRERHESKREVRQW